MPLEDKKSGHHITTIGWCGERNLGGRRGGERRNHLEDAGVEEAAGSDPEEGARDVVGVLGRLLDLSSRRRHGW